MVRMYALSLHQPFATLLAAGFKIHETRGRRAPEKLIGSRFLIHAAKRPPIPAELSVDLRTLCLRLLGAGWAGALPLGGFVGSGTLAGQFQMKEGHLLGAATFSDYQMGDWTVGRHAYRVEDPISFPLVPARGQQGWWALDFDHP